MKASAKRQPAPLVRCRCGRLHRSWSPFKVCNRCVRESKSRGRAEVVAAGRELERRWRDPSPAELEERRMVFQAILDRWLARQSLDHPWRVAGSGGEA